MFERYQAWQRELEREPVEFIAPPAAGAARATRAASSAPSSARDADDLTFVPNATTGVNMAARALDLQPGDEVLATDLEYGALRPHVGAACASAPARATFARPRRRALRRSAPNGRAPCSSRTSPRRPALLLPVEEIVARAREPKASRRSSTAPTRSRRSTSTSPRSARTSTPATATSGCARRRAPASSTCAPSGRSASTGTIVSWGYEEPVTFISRTERQGTRDSAAYLAVPDAIAFHREHDVRERCVALAREARRELVRAPRHGAARARRAGAPDGERVAAGAEARPLAAALRRAPHRDPDDGPRPRRPAADLDRVVHGAGGRRAAARRPPRRALSYSATAEPRSGSWPCACAGGPGSAFPFSRSRGSRCRCRSRGRSAVRRASGGASRIGGLRRDVLASLRLAGGRILVRPVRVAALAGIRRGRRRFHRRVRGGRIGGRRLRGDRVRRRSASARTARPQAPAPPPQPPGSPPPESTSLVRDRRGRRRLLFRRHCDPCRRHDDRNRNRHDARAARPPARAPSERARERRQARARRRRDAQPEPPAARPREPRHRWCETAGYGSSPTFAEPTASTATEVAPTSAFTVVPPPSSHLSDASGDARLSGVRRRWVGAGPPSSWARRQRARKIRVSVAETLRPSSAATSRYESPYHSRSTIARRWASGSRARASGSPSSSSALRLGRDDEIGDRADVDRKLHPGPPRDRPPAIHHDVLGDLEEPRALGLRLDALLEAAMRVQEHDLRRVLCLLARTEPPQAVVEDRLRVLLVQRLRPLTRRRSETSHSGYLATSFPFVARSRSSSARD